MVCSRRGFFSKALGACVGIVAVPEVAKALPSGIGSGGAHIGSIAGGLGAGAAPTFMGYPIVFDDSIVTTGNIAFGNYRPSVGDTVVFEGVWDDVEDPEFAAKALLED